MQRHRGNKRTKVGAETREARKSFLIDNNRQDQICAAFRAGKKTIELDGQWFAMRKITHDVLVSTKANEHGVKVKEHWLIVSPLEGHTPIANIPYADHLANSRADLL